MLNLQLHDEAQGDAPADEAKLHGKPDKTLRFSLCSDNLEGVSEGVCSLNYQEMLVSNCIVMPTYGKVMSAYASAFSSPIFVNTEN